MNYECHKWHLESMSNESHSIDTRNLANLSAWQHGRLDYFCFFCIIKCLCQTLANQINLFVNGVNQIPGKCTPGKRFSIVWAITAKWCIYRQIDPHLRQKVTLCWIALLHFHYHRSLIAQLHWVIGRQALIVQAIVRGN